MDLPLPPRLLELIASGWWPTRSNANMQNLTPLVEEKVVQQFAPDEIAIYFEAPPFQTVAQEEECHQKQWYSPDIYWMEFGAIHELNPELAVIIANFGMGSDTTLILDYRSGKENPSVWRLKCEKYDVVAKAFDNHWVKVADTFDDFARMLGLD